MHLPVLRLRTIFFFKYLNSPSIPSILTKHPGVKGFVFFFLNSDENEIKRERNKR